MAPLTLGLCAWLLHRDHDGRGVGGLARVAHPHKSTGLSKDGQEACVARDTRLLYINVMPDLQSIPAACLQSRAGRSKPHAHTNNDWAT